MLGAAGPLTLGESPNAHMFQGTSKDILSNRQSLEQLLGPDRMDPGTYWASLVISSCSLRIRHTL